MTIKDTAAALAAEAKRKDQAEQLKADIREVLMLPSGAGLRVFKSIFDRCGYSKPNVLMNKITGSLDANNMFFNEGRRNLWLELRAFISDKLKQKIEE